MATDFLGNDLQIGDEVIYLNYNGTSADLKRGVITKVFPHQAEMGNKRRAEYKIIKLLGIYAAPVVHGKWMGTVCTACGESVSFYYDCDYCPRCGVKMDG